MTVVYACPDCGMVQHHANASCLRCGVLLNESVGAPSPALSRDAVRSLAIGFALAVVFTIIPFTSILFNPLVTIVHELGHTVMSWLFGYPAFPAFDFAEGGGVTPTLDRVPFVLVIVYGFFVAGLWRVRSHYPTVLAGVALLLVYTWAAFSQWHHVVILAMGHGMELVMALVFLHRAMSGTTLLQADERPAYAMVGFLIWFHAVQFAWTLSRDAETQAGYAEGKGGLAHDFTVIASDYANMSVPGIARLFLVACVVGLFVPRLAYRYESAISLWAARVSPEG